MKRALLVAATVVALLIGIDRLQWFTGRVPLSNIVARVAEGAPEARISGQLLLFHGTHQINVSDLKPVGKTDRGVTFYRIHDWPDRMPGGWIYIPISDSLSYRYSTPTRPGTV